jgi:hypothetical protein
MVLSVTCTLLPCCMFVLVMCEPGWLCGMVCMVVTMLCYFSALLLVVYSVSMDSVGIEV